MSRQSAPTPQASFSVPRVPAWATPRARTENPVEAAFMAGSALNALDNLVQVEPDWSGAWRHRLALKAASACMTLLGRAEDEAALRDAWLLRQPGDEAGPAGNVLAGLKQNLPADIAYAGVGGPHMAEEGFDAYWPIDKLSVMGYVEVIKHLREILSIRRQLRERWLAEKPLAAAKCVAANIRSPSCSVKPKTVPSRRVTRQAWQSVVAPSAIWAASGAGISLMA